MTDSNQSNPERAQNEVPTIHGRTGLAAELDVALAVVMKRTDATGEYPPVTPGQWLEQQVLEILQDPAVIREVQWETSQGEDTEVVHLSWTEVEATLVCLARVLKGGVDR